MEAGLTYLDKPWLKSYKLGPYKLTESLIPYPREPIFKVLDEAAARYPAQTAVLYLGESLNYKQLKTQVDKLANALAGLGVERGDRVSVFLPNCIEFIISDWAISKTGAAIVPISVLRSDEGLLHEVGSSGSELIICRVVADNVAVLGALGEHQRFHILPGHGIDTQVL